MDSEFQSTFPRGERPDSPTRLFSIDNFNPRSRVGNDNISYHNTTLTGISIHVPAWGTTILAELSKYAKRISIHVPAWGTTIIWSFFKNHMGISIHVPAWGTTSCNFLKSTTDLISIHVPAWGTTISHNRFLVHHIVFQSTFPRGERLHLQKTWVLYINFNPRSRVGNDNV